MFSSLFGTTKASPTTKTSTSTSASTSASTSVINKDGYTPEQEKELTSEMLKAAQEVGPHAYELEGLEENEDLCYIEFGCQGDGSETQEEMANFLLEKIIELKEQGIKVRFVVLLGDNFYPNGAKTPFDEIFHICFVSKYKNEKWKNLLDDIFFLAGTGNHDAKISSTTTGIATYYTG